MLFLTCPHCEDRIIKSIAVGDRFEKMDCPYCEKVIFVHHSRWRPHVYKPCQIRANEQSKEIEIIDPVALKEIADHFGVTSNAVRHHIEKGVRRLNHPGRRIGWGVLPSDMVEKWKEINSQNNQYKERETMTEVSDRRYMRQYEKRHQEMMTTNTNPSEFEPTAEMRERWSEISDKTTIKMTDARRIDVPTLGYRPPTEARTETRESGPVPTFGTERLDLIQVGDHLCYYYQDFDTLFVRNAQRKMDNPETIKVELIIRSLGSIVWALAWLWGRIENPAIERRRRRGKDKKREV